MFIQQNCKIKNFNNIEKTIFFESAKNVRQISRM